LRLIRRAFQCYRCCGLPYLSQNISSAHRPIIQAGRAKRFLERWDRPLHWRTYHRLSANLAKHKANIPRKWRSKQITDRAFAPLIAYGTRVSSHLA
jgi:hypothetical protein